MCVLKVQHFFKTGLHGNQVKFNKNMLKQKEAFSVLIFLYW